MAGIVDPTEAAALAEALRANGASTSRRVGSVVPRDFTEPRTLSADRVARIRKMLSARLHSMTNALAGPLRGHPSLALGQVAEVNAQGLFDGFVRPFLVHGFVCGGQQGWILWSPEAARVACETILAGGVEPESDGELDDDRGGGAAGPVAGDPMLTRTERRVVGAMLDIVIEKVAGEFGLEAEPGAVWQEPEELTTLEDLGPDADSRRLLVHLSFEDERGSTSDLRIYLPGIAADEDESVDRADGSMPPHLTSVDLEVSAVLGGTDVPLSELLALERGDVIPLDARVGDLVDVIVEETTCARGHFGSHRGLLSVRVTEVGAVPPPSSPQE